MKYELKEYLIGPEYTVKQAMKRMTDIGQRTLFVADSKNVLLGALSDGDIRKHLLFNGSIKEKVSKIHNRKPVFVSKGYRAEEAKQLMLKRLIECIAVVDEKKQVLDVLTWGDLFSGKSKSRHKKINIQAVIMAGGKGTRLDPFTKILPKPLIPIGDKPIIEIIIEKIADYGVKEFFVSINHKARMIKSYFEDSDAKYNISFAEENTPLGTAGSLRLLKNIRSPFLVTNCDIIVETDYSQILEFHKKNRNDITIVASCKHYVIPYGVCEIENGGTLNHITEKPDYDFLVNTGMYIVNKKMIEMIPGNKPFNFTDLIEKAQTKGYKIRVYPISEDSWIDIGQWEEYRKAIDKLETR